MNKNFALIIDASKYQYFLDPAELAANNIAAVIHKFSQGAYEVKSRDIDPCYMEREVSLRNAGVDIGAYHWVDPIYSAMAQYDWIMARLEKYSANPSSFWLDIEQYWADWSNYRKILSSKKISDVTKTLAEKLTANLDIPVGIYTRTSFIKGYSTEILKWVHKYPLWLANWLWNAGVEKMDSWEEFRKYKLPPDNALPELPANLGVYTLWQFTGDRFRLPGIYARNRVQSPVDINLFNGSKTDYLHWLQGNYLPKPPTAPVQGDNKQYKCVVAAASVRSGPGTEYSVTRYLRGGDLITALNYDTTGRWALISSTEWVALWYSKGLMFKEI